MWNQVCVTVLLLVTLQSNVSSQDNIINMTIEGLRSSLDYIIAHYNEINVDCLFGIVFAGAIIDDTLNICNATYYAQLTELKVKTHEIYFRTIGLMEKELNWHYTQHIVDPSLWSKRLKFKFNEFRTAYPMRTYVDALFSSKTYENYTDGLSDDCLSSLIADTLQLQPKYCQLSSKCDEYVGNLGAGSGYMLTHKLLLLQVAKVRKCKMDPKFLYASIKSLCLRIYTETISVEYFRDLDDIFDLFLEQGVLCGYEGFGDFLKIKWLHYILDTQHSSGCFPAFSERRKRDTNEWSDGCADHTTGLGSAMLSLHLNSLMKYSKIDE